MVQLYRMIALIPGITLGMLNSAIAPIRAMPPPIADQVQAVATLLEGIMDTSAQASHNPKAPNVRMTTCRITVTAATPTVQPSIFLYQEQALSHQLSQPYRQRFLSLQPSADGQQVESRSFKPEQPKALIGLCNQPLEQRIIAHEAIGTPICSVLLKPLPTGTGFLGATPDAGCPANYRGASRITNQIELMPTGMNTWDRGFDATGKQVWGAQSEAYQFRRPVKPELDTSP